MKHTKQNVGVSHRIMAFFLMVCMVTTLFSPIVSAQAEGSTSKPIFLCGFAELPNEIKEQSIPLGVSPEKLNLPSTLEAVVNSVSEPVLPANPDKPLPATPSNTEPDKPAAEVPTPEVPKPDVPKTEPVTIHSVTWESSPLYNKNNPGAYTFTAVLPELYALAEGATLPKILITVYDDKTASKLVGSWQWNDPNSYISEGVLELPGVNKENPVNLEALIAMLPTSILSTLDASEPSNTPVSIPLAWSSKDFVPAHDGSFPVQGEYKFTATMQEGYALSAGAPPLEITVRLGGAMLLPNSGTFKTLEIREGTATGTVVVNLLDATSMAGNWALKPGADYYLCADLTAPTGAEHIKIQYGGADAPNGVTFANPPGGSYVPNSFTTHDYLDALVSYKDLTDPTYGPQNKSYAMQDGEMIYHIKNKSDTSTNTVFAIGLVVKDALYDGSKSIKNAVSVAVGSYANDTFTPASASDSTQTFDLKIAEKGKFNAYLNPKTLDAAIGAKGANGTMQYLANISDQPEILYDAVSFDLTYPAGAELEVGLSEAFSKTHENLGTMTVGEPLLSADGEAQTVHVTVDKGLKASASHGACFVRLNFPDKAGFKPGEKYFLTTANVSLTMGATPKDVAIKSGGENISYTLSLGGQDKTSLAGYDRIAYNHTIDASTQSYLVPLGNAWIKNDATSDPTPYGKTFEAKYNTTNTAANVSYITIPIGLNTLPTIEWSGIAADGTLKTGTISDPSSYQYRGKTFYFLPAKDFGIVSFTGAKADIGALPAKYTSVNGATSWLFARDNLSGAYGYFTTNEPGIQVVNKYRLYNTDPALRDRPNGDLSATATGTSSDYCGIGWSGAATLKGTKLEITTTEISVNAGEVAELTGFLYPYTTPSNGKGNGDDRGTATLVTDPMIYLTLPQGMSVVEKDLSFEIEKKDFQVNTGVRTTLSHQIENVSYLNTTGDGVSIYKITFPKGTRLGYFDETGNQSQLYYTIPLLTSKSLETRRYGLSELMCITAQNQPEATKYGGNNQGSINYALADKYGINGGKPLGTFASEIGNAEGTIITTPIGFGVQQSSEINLYSAASVTKIGSKEIPQAEQRWYAHSSDPNSIALLGKNSEGRLRLQVSNTSDTPGTDLRIILPIPQKGEDLGDSFMDGKSGFTMTMTYDKTASDSNFTAKYIKTTGTYDTITDKNNIVSYEECAQTEANAVLFTANAPVGKGESYIYLDFAVANGTPTSMDIWRPVYAYTVSGNRNVSNGSYVASEVAASSISGVAFADVNRNGVQDEGENGAADITVVAQDEKNRIVSTKTDANGAYQFLAIRESVIDMSFALSTEGQQSLRFNVPPLSDTTTGIASTVTPSADGLTASKTFVATAGKETVNAAVDGFVSLSYDGNTGATGNLPKTTTHVKGTSVTVAVKPDNLAVNGYQFTGWNTKTDGTGAAYQPGASIQMLANVNVTLYAQWELASYTVTFNYRGATSGNDEQSRVLKHGDAYGTLPTPTKVGYTFGGWFVDTTKPTSKVTDKTLFNLGADTTLYALWTPKSMTVSYNNGGGNGTIANKSVSWEAGVLPTDEDVQAITQNGYTLNGWSYNNNTVTGSDTYGNLAKTDSTATIELVAQWKAKTGFTVKYNLDGGTVDSAITIPDKTNVSWTQNGLLPVKNPVKDSYSFKGWMCDAVAVTGISTYGDIAKTDTTMEITLTAQWEAKSDNTVIYDTAGGSAISEKTGVKATDANLLPTETTKKPGYRLTGWKVGDQLVDANTVYSTLSGTNALTLTAQWEAKSYTIKYTPGNGSTISDATKSWSESGLLPTPPTRTGYTFGGWYYGSTKVAANALVSALIPQDDASNNTITLTAKWNERTYTVNYNSDGGTTFPQKNNVKYTAAGLLPDVSPTKLGYSFDGWKCGGKPVTADTACSALLTSDTDGGIELVAQWTAKTGFTVQYDTNGGTAVADKTDVKWTDSRLLPAANPTKTGCAFNGWLSGRTPVTNTTVFSALSKSDQSGTSVTLVAQWTAKTDNTVIYDTAGGNTIPDKTGVKAEDSGLLPTTGATTKPGYTLTGWKAGTTNVAADTAYNALSQTDTLTLTAQWTEKSSYTVKYNTDGGSAVTDKTSVKWTDTGLLPTTPPTKAGYTFEKWQLDGADVSAQSTYGALAVTEKADITLKAVWTVKDGYTVKYDTNGGSTVSDKANVKWTDSNLLPATPPTKAGYTFVKWQLGGADVSAQSTYGALAVTEKAEITLKAVWTAKGGYTVKYDSDGGTVVAEKTGVKWTDTGLLPTTNPTKAGYTFEKWQHGNTDVDATTAYNTLAADDTTTKITLKAVWTEKSSYTVKYDTNGGTVVADKTGVKWTDSSLLPAPPTKAGYTFEKWQLAGADVNAQSTYGALAVTEKAEITLTAHWSAEPGKAPDISGEVKDDKNKPVENASVKLTQGSETKYGPVTTDVQGKYFLPNLKPGIYNLVAKKGEQIVTVIITVADKDLRQNLTLPATKKNSVLEVGTDAPSVVVGNLDEIAKDTQLGSSETSLTIKLTVKKEEEQTSGTKGHTEIRQTAGANADILFLDAVLTKQVDNDPLEYIGNTNTKVLELVIPFDFTDKENIRVYRHHTDVDAFNELTAKPAAGKAMDKTCYIDKHAGLIHAYAQKFSAYAIAYDKKSGGGGTGGGGPDVVVPPIDKPWSPERTGVDLLLQTKNHIKYINGYVDLTVRPARNMTRAEAAQMFYNLLLDKTPSAQATFSDVNADAWYSEAVNKLTAMGVFKGYADGTFGAQSFITREEFCAIATRFTNVTDVESIASFSDVTTDMWAYNSIMKASALGWVNGFENGVFLPKNNITRSEVVTIVNNMLGRKADVGFVNAHKDMVKFTDLQNAGIWYYYDMVEASTKHEYVRGSDGVESWTNT